MADELPLVEACSQLEKERQIRNDDGLQMAVIRILCQFLPDGGKTAFQTRPFVRRKDKRLIAIQEFTS